MKTYKEIVSEWKKLQRENKEEIDARLDNFRILFAYNSNLMENPKTTYHNTREIFENGKVINYTGDLRTLFEIQNQKICYEYLKEKIENKEKISVELVKKIHKLLMEGCYDERRYRKGERAGEFKKYEYVVGDDIGIAPSEVESSLKDLIEEINNPNLDEDNVLIVAAFLHLTFETIHPFADGNGRVGRTLMNYYLMINDYPPTIIYEEDKEAYYMALAIFDKTGKLSGFTKFIEEQTEKTWNKQKTVKKHLAECIESERGM